MTFIEHLNLPSIYVCFSHLYVFVIYIYVQCKWPIHIYIFWSFVLAVFYTPFLLRVLKKYMAENNYLENFDHLVLHGTKWSEFSSLFLNSCLFLSFFFSFSLFLYSCLFPLLLGLSLWFCQFEGFYLVAFLVFCSLSYVLLVFMWHLFSCVCVCFWWHLFLICFFFCVCVLLPASPDLTTPFC